MTTHQTARLTLGIALAVTALWAAPARADEPAKELTAEERGKLEKEAAKWNKLAVLFYQNGKYAEATELAKKSLALRQKLYPADKFPDGHPDLAASLNNVGGFLIERGEYGLAEPYLRDALAMRRRLCPAERYPDGHPDLAISLDNMAFLLKARGEYGKAEPYSRDALAMFKKLYPADKYPCGHPDLAQSLNNMGALLQARGQYGLAEPYYREALAMRRKLYPADKFPAGHPDLAQSLNNLGFVLNDRGEYGQAEPFYREALEMRRKLFPADKFPEGHPDLANSLNNLGELLARWGEYGEAEPYYREALAMRRRLYPADKFPEGHPDLAISLDNMGSLLRDQGEYGRAEPYQCDALEMFKKLYPADKFPEGHPDLTNSLNNMAFLLEEQGKYGEAMQGYRDALAMFKKLYPADKYPCGHPYLANSFNNLGFLLLKRGEHTEAAEALAEASAMYEQLITAFAHAGAEAEALNLAASLPNARDAFLAATSYMKADRLVSQYALLWPGKAALARTMQQRRRLLQAAAKADESTRRKLQTLTETRQDLARLLLAPARPRDADREALLQELTDRKERLEKELADVLPVSDREMPPYTDLARALPDGAAFLDFYRYRDWDAKANKWDAGHYAVFVLRKGRPIRRVELTEGDAIDKDLQEWRNDVIHDLRSDAAGRLRKNLWQPVAEALGDSVDTVYVCPDGLLSALPWPALPGTEPGRVLLEDYAFAVVPSGPFLLEQLTQPADPKRQAGALLAVGGVSYDCGEDLGKPWPPLPAADKERKDVVKERPKGVQVVERTGAEATVARLVQDLPKARWAHLATHGFFAAPDSKEREHLFRPDDFLMGVGGERRGAAARNPLTLSGLVLASANQPTDADSGILSGEAVAGLNLDAMDLAVLSACQTGLGEAAAGEGVFGLQRAFHIGGARNVIASLWKVDDEATAALMNLFYHYLWEKGEKPLEALHHAQLKVYRNPWSIPALARGRGAIDFDETAPKASVNVKERPVRTGAVKDWAAFVLSGAGR